MAIPGLPESRASKFNNPFNLHSKLYIPSNWYDSLRFAVDVSMEHPEYTNAASRTVAHFITDLAFKGLGDYEIQKQFKEYLLDELGLMEKLHQGGLSTFIQGNAFLRIHYPFDRYLIDRRNGKYRKYNVTLFGDYAKYNYKTMTYTVPDPSYEGVDMAARPTVDLEFQDSRSHDKSRIRLRFIDPRQMYLQMNFISGTIDYIYRFEEFFVAAVKAGNQIHQVNETPMEMLMAIKNDMDFRFNEGSIFHFKYPFITAGVSNNGWGIPHILLNYSNIHQIQVLRCINEAVGRDYILPIRLLSPSQSISGGGGDIMGSANMAIWKSAMSAVISQKRKTPDMLFTVPFPVSYQEAGGGGKALAPVDLIQQAQQDLLNNAGFAQQLWNMDLTVQQTPTGIRLFESSNAWLPRILNRCVKWVVKEILDYLGEKQLEVYMLKPAIADNLENKSIYLQLGSGGELSRQTVYGAFNIDDPVEEQRRRTKEDMEIQIMKQREGEKMERRMQMGSADQVVGAIAQAEQEAMAQQQAAMQGGGGGGAPPPAGGGGGGGGGTPLDVQQQAEETAEQLFQMDESSRRKEMNTLRASNPTLYAVVKQKMEERRAQAASEGRKQVSAQ